MPIIAKFIVNGHWDYVMPWRPYKPEWYSKKADEALEEIRSFLAAVADENRMTKYQLEAKATRLHGCFGKDWYVYGDHDCEGRRIEITLVFSSLAIEASSEPQEHQLEPWKSASEKFAAFAEDVVRALNKMNLMWKLEEVSFEDMYHKHPILLGSHHSRLMLLGEQFRDKLETSVLATFLVALGVALTQGLYDQAENLNLDIFFGLATTLVIYLIIVVQWLLALRSMTGSLNLRYEIAE